MPAERLSSDGNGSHTFLVRMWHEKSGDPDGSGEWRGEVRDVTDNVVAYFRHIDGLAAAIRKLGIQGR